MATTLTPSELNSVQQATNPTYMNGDSGAPVYGSAPIGAFNVGGYNYAPAGDGSYWRFQYDPTVKNPSGYAGRAYDKVDAQGNVTAGGNLPSDYGTQSTMQAYGPFAMMAAGMAPALLGAGAMGGAAGGTAGGLDSAGGVLNNAVMSGAGTGAADAAGGAAAGAAGDVGTMGAFPMTSVGGYTIPGTMSTIGGAGASSGIGGLLTSLGVAPGAASTIMGLLGPAATALGAWAGSKGVKQTQTDTKSINPMLNPYVYGTPGANGQGGSPGLLGYTNQMLDQGMSPQGQAAWQSMMSKGMGLLNQPVAQNGFAQFTKGKY